MRPVLHGDISAAARALLAVPLPDRDRLSCDMIAEAELADQHVAKTGRLHPLFGNGSLMAVANNRPLAEEPNFGDLQYCQCFEMVLRKLIRFHITQRRS
ncbi:hypothetical protein [uncultured Ruegeria sp.]|uniref:DUF7742 family protein n=1 Tax=uncultured Ruegeria sp. TaxID=259304 RepID=UPI00262E97FB|nr:hypothetical protein [uncultured Ruegeria sp.]